MLTIIQAYSCDNCFNDIRGIYGYYKGDPDDDLVVNSSIEILCTNIVLPYVITDADDHASAPDGAPADCFCSSIGEERIPETAAVQIKFDPFDF